jgi:CBS domain-containing protein
MTMMNEFVHSIMTQNPITLTSKATLADVKSIFDENHIHHLPVVDETGTIKGLVTTYDLWQLNKNFDEYASIPVSDIMNTHILKVSKDDKIGTAAELFLDRRFHALPVVDQDEKLVGIVTSFDVLRYEFKREYVKPILFKEILDPEGQRAVV